MQLQYSALIIPLIAAALVSGGVAVYAWSRRAAPSAIALALMAFAIAEWSLGYALEIAGADLSTKLFWGKLQYIGIATIPLFWVIFAFNHANQGNILTHRRMFILSVVPIITIFLALTTELHGLIWKETSIAVNENFSALAVSYGLWFWIHFAYSYILLAAGTFIVLRSIGRMQGLYRGQTAALIISVLAPWIGNILYFSGLSPIPNLDPTPFAFTISVAGIAWGIFGFRLVDLSPIARELVIEGMREGMIVLDARERVADINPAAARMIGVPVSQALGKPIDEVFYPWPHLVEQVRNAVDVRSEIAVGEGQAQRRYEVQISLLQDRQGHSAGRVVTIRDSDEARIPPPRFAARETVPATPTSPESQPEAAGRLPKTIWGRLADFFTIPVLTDLKIPADVNPGWFQTRERSFTLILRVAAVMGTIALVFSFPYMRTGDEFGAHLGFISIVGVMWFLGLARQVEFRVRTSLFLLLIYGFAFVETLNFGYSAESFAFFLTFVVVSVLLADRTGGIVALVVSMVTLGIFGWLIGQGGFIPLENFITPPAPRSLQAAISSMFAFLAMSTALVAAIRILMNSLTRTWQRELQALNLLQQERDLLEQHVEERTRDLAEARDRAIKTSDDLRKYFLAIEQSGNTIVITDTKGRIEYVNPMFTALTGYTAEEALGNSSNIVNSGEHDRAFYESMWSTIGSGNIWHGEFHNRRKDGSLFWEQATIAPVHDSNGKVTHYVAIKENVTDRKQLQEQIKMQNEYLSVLHQVTLDLLNRRELDDVLQAIVDNAAHLLDAPFGEIMLVESDELVVQAFTKNQPSLKGDRVPRSSALLSWQAFDSKEPVVLDDYLTWEHRRTVYDENKLHAVADFPVLVDDMCIGVLAVGRSRSEHPFTPEQIQSGVLFARLAALVLDNANLYSAAMQEITERKRAQDLMLSFLNDMHALQQIHLVLSEVTDLDELYIQIIKLSQGQLGFDRLGLFIVDDIHHQLVGTYGVDETGHVRNERDYSEPITADHWTLDILNSLQHAKVWEDAPLFDEGHMVGTGWKVASTLWNGQKAIGYIIGDNFITHRAIRPYELELISLLGSTFGHLIERKSTESLLQESEARFRQIVENASDIIYRTNADGRFTYANPTTLFTAGFDSDAEMLGRHFTETAHPDWRTKLKRFYALQFMRQEPSSYYEFPVVNRKTGREIWLGQSVQVIKEGEKVVGFQAVARDITQLRQAQDALLLSRDQALDASRLKSQLLAKVSHELRTPLGGILGYAELLQLDMFGPLNEEQKAAASQIVESTNYLDRMINELLDQAQIEARTVILRSASFSPANLLKKVEASMSVLAHNKGLGFSASLEPDVPGMLIGDEQRLQQILINLTGNAIKYTRQGQVNISMYRPDPAHWAIKVSDTGAGIPKEAQAYIFEPFRQVDNSITRENRGTGLGLSITKQLVELMEGKIAVQSEVDLGSTFTVTLPITN